jgi:hypothetical protein
LFGHTTAEKLFPCQAPSLLFLHSLTWTCGFGLVAGVPHRRADPVVRVPRGGGAGGVSRVLGRGGELQQRPGPQSATDERRRTHQCGGPRATRRTRARFAGVH